MKLFLCPFQKTVINPKNQISAYVQHTSKKKNISRQELKYLIYKETFGEVVTKDVFSEIYVNKKYSLPDFLKEYNMSFIVTLFLLDYHNIEKRNLQEANKNIKRKEKYKKTCLEKYGVDNVSKLKNIKNKKEQTFLKNYGETNIWKTKEYYVKLHQKMLDKYGAKSVPNLHGNINPFGIKTLSDVEKKKRIEKANIGYLKWWENLTDDQKNEIIEKRMTDVLKTYSSSLEIKIKNALDNLNIKYKHQFWIDRKSYDFRIKNTNILLEINGDFWHANPSFYKENDVLNFPDKQIYANEIWQRDLSKKELCEKYNYILIYIWESEIKNLNQPEIMKLIIDKLSYYNILKYE